MFSDSGKEVFPIRERRYFRFGKRGISDSGNEVFSIRETRLPSRLDLWDVKMKELPFGSSNQKILFELKEHDEVITKLTGTYDDTTQVRSLAFYTSKGRKHGEYGQKGSTFMSLPVAKGKIIGFFGSNRDHLNTIGVIIEASPYSN
ncbi:hypothetical protein OSB04_un000471 [Centaurea solstitialis]|uniref:Jacalin-type lectin domain-containing protein n=1 Tax=Centaurea solstitialis TaxID=347529 RepID=A0AA38S5V9_9ASTR|nr:hypothetical protein OSB04_un000471 [Centaurea solstitialis]